MKAFALLSIKAYQRFISPHKGFCCAYHAHTGNKSCSVLGFRAIRRYGVVSGIAILRQRFRRCAVAHKRYSPRRLGPNYRKQGGFCDAGCDVSGCDMPCDVSALDCNGASGLLDCGDCGGSGGSGNGSRRRKGVDEQAVYIPPLRKPKPWL